MVVCQELIPAFLKYFEGSHRQVLSFILNQLFLQQTHHLAPLISTYSLVCSFRLLLLSSTVKLLVSPCLSYWIALPVSLLLRMLLSNRRCEITSLDVSYQS